MDMSSYNPSDDSDPATPPPGILVDDVLGILAAVGPKALDPYILAHHLREPIGKVFLEVGTDPQEIVNYVQRHWQRRFLAAVAPLSDDYADPAVSPLEALTDLMLLRLEICSSVKGQRHAHLPHILASHLYGEALWSLPMGCPSVALLQKACCSMLSLCNLALTGPYGLLRQKGLMILYVTCLDVWAHDTSPGYQHTMATMAKRLGWLETPFPQIWSRDTA